MAKLADPAVLKLFGKLKWLGIVALAAIVAACNLLPPNLNEISGTYRLNAPAGVGILTIKPDGIWKYKFDDNKKIPTTGQWSREPSADSFSTVAIVLEHFQLGFDRHSDLPVLVEDRPGFFFLNLERTWTGDIRDCLGEDYNLCFIKQ
jgi:hypothetical protein